MDIQTLKEEIAGLHDARRTAYGHIRHKLEDIVITGLCVAICGGEDFSDMETFGREREQWLRQFLELPNGIPDADTFRRVFERLDPRELGRCLRRWLAVERGRRGVVAVDGKTIKGSANAKHGAYHVVSAFAAESQLVLGETCVEEKSNEIEAVPELLEMVDVEGAIVTADAMSCQRRTAAKIVERGADYVLGLKGNQPELLEDVRLYFGSFGASAPAKSTLDKGHGRVERREYSLATDVGWMAQRLQWAGLNGVGRVVSTVWEKDAERTQARYFVTSLTDVGEFAYAVRRHWSIESQLHWCLDVVFREDASRARKDNSPLNMNILRKTALTCLNETKYGRLSKKKKMFKAALNPEVMLNILFKGKK
jgi:predicted transposase YbfD/YdcC